MKKKAPFKKFILEIFDYKNDAMVGQEVEQTSNILRDVADKISIDKTFGAIIDENGNGIGTWRFIHNFKIV